MTKFFNKNYEKITIFIPKHYNSLPQINRKIKSDQNYQAIKL